MAGGVAPGPRLLLDPTRVERNVRRFLALRSLMAERLGPIQYDLASLLIDPYVDLPRAIQNTLLTFCVETLSPLFRVDPDQFLSCYQYCAVTRNLQILGAFGFLSRLKKKTYFEKYIPNAIKTLKYHFSTFQREEFPTLTSIVRRIGGAG